MEKVEKDKNLKLWKMVEKTDPKYTRTFEYENGKALTTVGAYYQIKIATTLWGPYGSVWGFKDISIAKYGNQAVYKAVFYYPGGSFEILNSIPLQTRDFAKKLETDTLTKALSRLGFSADVFMGKFEDSKYIQKLKEMFKFKLKPNTTTATVTKQPEKIQQPGNGNNTSRSTTEKQIVDALKQHGLAVKKLGTSLIATGKTFEKKDFLKSIGFKWSNKQWAYPIDSTMLKLAE